MSLGISVLASAPTFAQDRALSDYLPKFSWDVSKSGPLIVIDPEHTFNLTQGSGLNAFDREVFPVGSLSVIGPSQMTLIDDSFSQAPNFYDGLPRDAKVLYLLSTLSPDQVRASTTQGIGLADLHGEQVNVFKSLLPQPFVWTSYMAGGGPTTKELDGGTIPFEQLGQIKLKIQRTLSFDLLSAQGNGAYRPTSGYDDVGRSGEQVFKRVRADENDKPGLGLDVRQVVKNKPKNSQLDYNVHQFDAQVDLAGLSHVKDVVDRIAGATGTEIYADIRISGLGVKTFGGVVRSGDLLKGLALAVTGTFRKVGNTYLLTSDLQGLGSRKLKFEAWLNANSREVSAREEKWRKSIVASGVIATVQFDAKDSVAPDGQSKSLVDKTDDSVGGDNRVSISDLSPADRDFVQRAKKQGGPFDTQKVGIHSEISYGFILPNGIALQPEQNLGSRASFRNLQDHSERPGAKLEPYALAPESKDSFIFRINRLEDLAIALSEAHKYGFKNFWLDTQSKDVLAAALRSDLRVSLVIRPWEIFGSSSQLTIDRNILGDTGVQLAARRFKEPDWLEYVANVGSPLLVDSISPTGREGTRWSMLSELAHTPGLAGVVISDTEPQGYEALVANASYGGYPSWLGDLNEFGYSTTTRVTFLRANGIDPLDLVPANRFGDINLVQPFFPDEHLGGDMMLPQPLGASLSNVAKAWVDYRAKLNLDETRNFLSLLADLTIPVMAIPRMNTSHVPPNLDEYFVPWKPGQELMVINPGTVPSSPDVVYLFPFNRERNENALANLGYMLKSSTFNVAVDLSEIDMVDLSTVMERYFTKSPLAQ